MLFRAIFIMGVSGCGKTTIGELLSEKTGYPFYDADNFHSLANKEKMRAGHPLNDEDRWPWLDSIHTFVSEEIKKMDIIMACSALKKVYRDRLSSGIEEHCRWIFLNGSYDTIMQRMQHRSGHYMPASLLQSQFDALEVPADAIEVDISKSPAEIAEFIISKI